MPYTITLTLKNVTDGDVTSVAQEIWDAHAEELDAGLGDFDIAISKSGEHGGWFRLDWEPAG